MFQGHRDVGQTSGAGCKQRRKEEATCETAEGEMEKTRVWVRGFVAGNGHRTRPLFTGQTGLKKPGSSAHIIYEGMFELKP